MMSSVFHPGLRGRVSAGAR